MPGYDDAVYALQVAATEAQQAAANSTAGGVGTSAGTGASPKPMTAAQLAAAAAAGYKSATGGRRTVLHSLHTGPVPLCTQPVIVYKTPMG